MMRRVIATIVALTCAQAQAQVFPENATVKAVPGLYRYGAGGPKWAYTWQTKPFACGRSTFPSDPAPGKAKTCEKLTINSISCLPAILGGSGLKPDVSLGLSGGLLSWWCPSSAGPQLRIVAGDLLASASAARCFVTASTGPAAALAACAPGSAMDAGPRAVWEPEIARILKGAQ